MNSNNVLSEIRLQRETLDLLLSRLENKVSLELKDYQLCQITASAVEENLKKIQGDSIDELVRQLLWQ
jgi:hypothetical protein